MQKKRNTTKPPAGETRAKNRKYRARFCATPFSQRLLLMPQCLRNHKRCKARDIGWGYVCRTCGACGIMNVISEARELGYGASYILKGGRALERVLAIENAGRKDHSHAAGKKGSRPRAGERRIEAVLGVACGYEGMLGIALCEQQGLIPQFVPLLRDGCVDTKVDWALLSKTLSLGKNS
ncbi:MAG: DUF116 domain-containing protein [Planctomycetota bacterium]|nr:DUF116 domain-containing protein [Planctomycetota bacterium]